MIYINKFLEYFSLFEKLLWLFSIITISAFFILFDRTNYFCLVTSLIGVTSLIFIAKGNPFGQFLMVVFSVLYGIISYKFTYYGEVATYVGMTAPMALFSLISWLRHPYKGRKSEVEVNHISTGEIFFMVALTAAVTIAFYFILLYFGTANIIFSTISVTTSFLAVYLTFRRSPYYAFFYALNDIVLIVLWVMASMVNRTYICVVVCFIVFLINDMYGFINWKRMSMRQKANKKS